MRKVLLSLVAIAAAVFATSCVNELEEGIQGNAGQVTFTVNAPELATRAFGDGASAKHLMYAVYDETTSCEIVSGVSLLEPGSTTEINAEGKGSVTLDLLDGSTYSILFWAVNEAYEGAFTINWDTKSIEMNPTIEANNEAYDAFYAYVEPFTVNGAITKSVTLTRPFSQLNIGTSDFVQAAKAGFVRAGATTSVEIENMPNVLDCTDGSVDGDVTILYTTAAIPDSDKAFTVSNYEYLAMNYVLVGDVRKLVDLTLTSTSGTKSVTNEYVNVPLQRNYRTNVYGALLTNGSKFDIDVDEELGTDNELNMEIVKVQADNAQDLQNAIDNAEEGKNTVIELTGDIDLNDLFGLAPVATRAESSKGVVIPAERIITLDLKGFELKYVGDVMGEAMITNNGKLVVTNGTVSYNYTGAADASYGKGNYTILNQGGELVVNDAKIYNISEVAPHAMFAISNHSGDVVVNGGEVVTTKGQGIRLAPFSAAAATVTVNAGLIKAPRAVQVHLPGGNSVKKATLNVNGGVLEATDDEYNLAIYGLATNDSAENTTINIAGGEFKGMVALNAAYTETAKANSVVVTGGTFKDEYGVYSYSEDDAQAAAVISISGGLFASDAPKMYAMDEGYVFEQNAEGMYEVVYTGFGVVNGEYVVMDKAGLEAFAATVNEGETYKGKTVKLAADIDLKNEAWTPIGNSTNKFQGTFDGQEHTIKNLVVNGEGKSNQGLFGMTTDGEIKNLVVENAKVSGRLNVAVVAGTPYTSKYTNITVKGHVEVNGMAYVGGVGGKNAYANWNNITVNVDETSYVKANSVEDGIAYRTYVGGVVGFNGEGGHSFKNITSNIDVEGSTIDVGGLFGIAHYGNNFEKCSCSGNVEVTGAEEAAEAEEIGGIAGVWHNQTGKEVTFTNCSFTGTLKANIIEGVDLSDNTIVGAAYSESGKGKLIIDGQWITSAADAAELNTKVSEGYAVISLPAGEYTFPTTFGENVTIVCEEGTEFTGNSKLNINGATVVGATFSNPTGTAVDQTINGTFKGCTFDGSNALRWCYAGETVVFENCVFSGDLYGVHFDGGANDVVFKNCTFSGFNAMGGAITQLTLEECTFKANGRSGYNGINMWGNTKMVDCEFTFDGTASEWIDAMGSNMKYEFVGCTVNGAPLTAANVGDYGTGNTITITVE